MNEKDYSHLRHMLEAAQTAVYIAEQESLESVDENITIKLAIAKAAEIIGNSAGKVSDETMQAYPGIDWDTIIALGPDPATQTGMRYKTSDLWHTATVTLPPLVKELTLIIDDVRDNFPPDDD